MDIAGLSISMKQSQLSTDVSLALLKKMMNVSTENTQTLIKAMEMSTTPNLGANLDLRA